MKGRTGQAREGGTRERQDGQEMLCSCHGRRRVRCTMDWIAASQTTAGALRIRGKSELRRAVRRVTPGQGNLKDSGTENIPLSSCRLTVRSGAAGSIGPRYSFPVHRGAVNRHDESKGEKVR